MHKGIVCPACKARGLGFNYVADVKVLRLYRGVTSDGKLLFETAAHEYTEDENARLVCHACNHEFSIPEDVLDEVAWT